MTLSLRYLTVLMLFASATAVADEIAEKPIITIYDTASPGIAYGFAAGVTRTLRFSAPLLSDFTVAGMFSARNGPGVNQWAFGIASEAIAYANSQSILVGLESTVANFEPNNRYPKVAINAVYKTRLDNEPSPGQAWNENSMAMLVTAQSDTGFERGLVFGAGSLHRTKALERPVAIDLSDLTDDEIGHIDLIRLRVGVALRYDPVTKSLYLHKDEPQ